MASHAWSPYFHGCCRETDDTYSGSWSGVSWYTVSSFLPSWLTKSWRSCSLFSSTYSEKAMQIINQISSGERIISSWELYACKNALIIAWFSPVCVSIVKKYSSAYFDRNRRKFKHNIFKWKKLIWKTLYLPNYSPFSIELYYTDNQITKKKDSTGFWCRLYY